MLLRYYFDLLKENFEQNVFYYEESKSMRQKDIYLQSEGDAWFQRNLASLETKELFPEIDFLIPF